MTFDVLQSTLPSPWWFADINIYNLTSQQAQEHASQCYLGYFKGRVPERA